MTTKHVKSVCPYCGVGCGILMEVMDDRVVKVTGDKEHPANYGRLCTKGLTSWQAIADPGRMEYAHMRTDRKQAFTQVSMSSAIAETARRLRGIMDEYGPDALSFYVSGQMTLEAQYLINKLAKGFIGTNQIESNSRLCMASAGSGYKLSLGADGPPGSYEDMEATHLFFVIGSNMADCHPILFLRMMDRVKKGAKLIVVDPRRTGTADKADLYLQIKPGTDLALLNGILHLLVKDHHTDPSFIAKYTAGWNGMEAFVEEYTPERVSDITGIAEEDIRQAARWIGEAEEWMSCWTMGLNQSTHGTWHTNAICNLHLATGAICRLGSGPFSLTGQPNAMGGREMGYMGPGLPGQRSVFVEAERRYMEQLWGIDSGSIRMEAGQGTIDMFRDMQKGRIKACWIICTNPVASVANRDTVVAGLEAADYVITQDCYMETETNLYADMMLPGALWAEGEGVMINSERNMTLLQRAVSPPGEAMPDWEIIARVACEMGYERAFSYRSADEVFEEIKQTWNPKSGYDLRGASYEQLRERPLQWPISPEQINERNPIRYRNDGTSQTLRIEEDGSRPEISFPTEHGKGNFFARPYMPPAEMPDDDYPFVLNTGRLQHQWHTLTKTGKIPALNKLNPGPFVELHPADAEALGVKEGDPIQITSRRGKAILPAVITDRVMAGCCFAPFHWNDQYGQNLTINAVTNDAVDPISLQPEFKYCAVKLMKAASELEVISIVAGNEMRNREKGAVHVSQLDTLAKMIGINEHVSFTLANHEKLYLDGFVAGLRADPSYANGTVPVLPHSAPIDPAKRYWVDGMLAGLFSRTYLPGSEESAAQISTITVDSSFDEDTKGVTKGDTNTQATQVKSITILWASQTGTAEAAASLTAQLLKTDGTTIKLSCMDSYAAIDLCKEQYVLFVVSTFGSGEPPDNGISFWSQLNHVEMPRLSGVQYAVLALGDSNYETFCAFGRDLDAKLKQLGASRITMRMDCEPDYEENLRHWIDRIIQELTDNRDASTDRAEVGSLSMNEYLYDQSVAPRSGSSVVPLTHHYDRNSPLKSKLIMNRLLNGSGSAKETRHYVFDLKHSGMRYEAGDALGVWPMNCPELVVEILEALHLNGADEVLVDGQGIVTLETALLHHYEIVKITTKMLRYLFEQTQNEQIAELLNENNKDQLRSWLWGRQLIDLLHEYPVKMNISQLLKLLQPLKPRLYSISSSPKLYPDEIHLTVATVRYSSIVQDRKQQMRKGVCSTFLADYAENRPDIPIFIQPSKHFRVPSDPDAPMIMVGAGTGIAPFRAFLQERHAIEAKGKNWLFFGEQSKETEFYYQEEIEEMLRIGVLNRIDTAFSRDQEEKRYVQHCMMEKGKELYDWLEQGAYFYVCGDAAKMAKDVDAALKLIIQKYSGMSQSESEAHVKKMTQMKRYVRDVY